MIFSNWSIFSLSGFITVGIFGVCGVGQWTPTHAYPPGGVCRSPGMYRYCRFARHMWKTPGSFIRMSAHTNHWKYYDHNTFDTRICCLMTIHSNLPLFTAYKERAHAHPWNKPEEVSEVGHKPQNFTYLFPLNLFAFFLFFFRCSPYLRTL